MFKRVWPHQCHLCGGVAGALPVCAACAADLPRLPAARCPICALPVAGTGLPCGACQHKAPAFDASYAAFIYASPLRELILAFKHGHGFGLAGWFADEMSASLPAQDFDWVVPVPLHRGRLCERGFNPACELSRRIARAMGARHALQLVVRERSTPHLAGLRGKARRQAVRGAFRCEDGRQRDLAGGSILLVDDVMTSGATLDALAACLRAGGAARISNLVLARTLRQSG